MCPLIRSISLLIRWFSDIKLNSLQLNSCWRNSEELQNNFEALPEDIHPREPNYFGERMLFSRMFFLTMAFHFEINSLKLQCNNSEGLFFGFLWISLKHFLLASDPNSTKYSCVFGEFLFFGKDEKCPQEKYFISC